MIDILKERKGCSDELQNEEQLRQDIANTQSELEATLESHRATLAEIQGGSASHTHMHASSV